MLLAPSSHVLLRLTQFTWHDGISNLMSLITKTKLGLSGNSAVLTITYGKHDTRYVNGSSTSKDSFLASYP
jgi:hypothetical protein